MVQFVGNVKADVKLPFIAAEEDSGPFVEALVKDGPGKNLIAYREWLTVQQLVETFAKATGIPAKLTVLRPEELGLDSSPEELKEEIRQNMAYFNEYGYKGREDVSVVHRSQVGL